MTESLRRWLREAISVSPISDDYNHSARRTVFYVKQCDILEHEFFCSVSIAVLCLEAQRLVAALQFKRIKVRYIFITNNFCFRWECRHEYQSLNTTADDNEEAFPEVC